MDSILQILKSENIINNDIEPTEEELKEKQYKLMKAVVDSYNSITGELNVIDGYDCDKCKNRGDTEILIENNGYYITASKQCECMKVRSMIKKIQKSGLGNVFRDYTFAKYKDVEPWQKHLKEKAMQFVNDKNSDWFFIGGQSGAGKSHLCSAITISYLKQNIAARYMLWRDDVTRIKAIINNAEEYAEEVNELKTVPVLYIDDLFKMGRSQGVIQPPTSADVNLAYEILNYRSLNKGLITVISSEYSLNDIINIDEALGGRIGQKTIENGYCINISKDIKKNYRLKNITEV